MPNDDPTAILFQRYLENSVDPKAAAAMAKQPDVTARYFDEFITSGRAAELNIKERVQLFAIIGITCRRSEADLLKKWVEVETDARIKHLLEKKLQILKR